MIIIASRPPLTLQRLYKMHATPRRVNARPRRRRVVKKIASALDVVSPGVFLDWTKSFVCSSVKRKYIKRLTSVLPVLPSSMTGDPWNTVDI